MINRSIQQEDIIFVNIYINRGAPNYIKQMLTDLKGEIDSKTVTLKEFTTPFTSVDRSFQQKINKEISTLNNTLDQMELTDT